MLSEAKDMREQTRPEFEAYEKTVETALFNLQRSAGPEDRSGFEEVSSLAREIVELRRQMLELSELQRSEEHDKNATQPIDSTQANAAQQRVSRIHELEHETSEQRERIQDNRDR